MKTLLITLSILFSITLFSDELSWVDDQVKAIKPARSGMSLSLLKGMHEPFIFLEKNRTPDKVGNKKKKKIVSLSKSVQTTSSSSSVKKVSTMITLNRVLVLSLIMNNSAMISGEWYKIGDDIDGYKVSEINRNSVLLRKHKKKLLLSTKSTSQKLKFLK